MLHCYSVATPDLPQDPTIFGLSGDFEKNVAAVAECGFDGMDLVVRDVHELDVARVVRAVRSAGLLVPMICTGEIVRRDGLALAAPDSEVRAATVERFRGFIDLAAELASATGFATGVNIGRSRGRIEAGCARSQVDAWALDSFSQLATYAEPRGVRVALEPVTCQMTNYLTTVGEVLPLVQAVGSPSFGYMLDTQHVYLDERDPEAVFREHAARTMHIHVVDANRGIGKGGALGSGGIDFARALRLIREAGYNGSFSHEAPPLGSPLDDMRRDFALIDPLLHREYGA